LKPQEFASNPDISVDTVASTVVGKASTTVPVPFLAILGVAAYKVEIESTALLAVGGNSELNIEISMMLDVTGSMGWGNDKLGTMQAAAKDLIDIVVWDDQSEYTSKVALAPFSTNVNVGATYFQTITGQSGSANKKTCVWERNTASRYTDDAPGPGNRFLARYSNKCKPKNSRIMPLTNDKAALKARIDTFTAQGGTAGHIGTAWPGTCCRPNGTTSFGPETTAPPTIRQAMTLQRKACARRPMMPPS